MSMNYKVILSSAPSGSTHYDGKYYRLTQNGKWLVFTDSCPSYEECVKESEKPSAKTVVPLSYLRSIVELEKELSICKLAAQKQQREKKVLWERICKAQKYLSQDQDDSPYNAMCALDGEQ